MVESTHLLIDKYLELLKLHNYRKQLCDTRLARAIKKKNVHEKAVADREALISTMQAQLALTHSSDCCGIEARGLVERRRYWLHYDLEKEQFYLPMEHDELREANAEYELALKAAQLENAKIEMLNERIKWMSKKHNFQQENKLEIELLESRMSRGQR